MRFYLLFLLYLFISFSAYTQSDTFYFVSDNDNRLYSINRSTGAVVDIGSTGRSDIEAIAYYPITGSQTLYAADGGDFGTLNTSTGAFTEIS